MESFFGSALPHGMTSSLLERTRLTRARDRCKTSTFHTDPLVEKPPSALQSIIEVCMVNMTQMPTSHVQHPIAQKLDQEWTVRPKPNPPTALSQLCPLAIHNCFRSSLDPFTSSYVDLLIEMIGETPSILSNEKKNSLAPHRHEYPSIQGTSEPLNEKMCRSPRCITGFQI
jgi:hypothetical protein